VSDTINTTFRKPFKKVSSKRFDDLFSGVPNPQEYNRRITSVSALARKVCFRVFFKTLEIKINVRAEK